MKKQEMSENLSIGNCHSRQTRKQTHIAGIADFNARSNSLELLQRSYRGRGVDNIAEVLEIVEKRSLPA
jgi:hypothetical protein